MSVNLYGNINGHTYTPPTINLLDSNKNTNEKPLTAAETFLKDKPAVKVNISEEGLKALHGSKLPGSTDPFETAAKIAYMSEHQPVESFTNQFSQMLPKNYTMSENGEAVFTPHTMKEKEDALIDGYKALYDEISKGYEDGTRVRYIEDESSEDGFRKLTKEEELSILKMEFDDFVDSRFGEEKKAYENTVKEAIKDVQDIMRKLGKEVKSPDVSKLETIPDGFAEKLKTATDDYTESHRLEIDAMKDFIKTLKANFSPMEMSLQKMM